MADLQRFGLFGGLFGLQGAGQAVVLLEVRIGRLEVALAVMQAGQLLVDLRDIGLEGVGLGEIQGIGEAGSGFHQRTIRQFREVDLARTTPRWLPSFS